VNRQIPGQYAPAAAFQTGGIPAGLTDSDVIHISFGIDLANESNRAPGEFQGCIQAGHTQFLFSLAEKSFMQDPINTFSYGVFNPYPFIRRYIYAHICPTLHAT
jgi:hypothetical protein